MTDLDGKEQKHVRTALRFLCTSHGDWKSVARALPFESNNLRSIMRGDRDVSAMLAFRTARLAGVSVDDLLTGRFRPGACPRCGHVPDFADEPTVVEGGPEPAAGGGLKLVP